MSIKFRGDTNIHPSTCPVAWLDGACNCAPKAEPEALAAQRPRVVLRTLMFTLGVALALLGLAVALAVWATGVRFNIQQEYNDHASQE